MMSPKLSSYPQNKKPWVENLRTNTPKLEFSDYYLTSHQSAVSKANKIIEKYTKNPQGQKSRLRTFSNPVSVSKKTQSSTRANSIFSSNNNFYSSSPVKMQSVRQISKVFTPKAQAEGDGAEVRRIIGTGVLRNLDPFLMMDHFEVVYPHGFPDHPHRGFETVTYMLDGKCKHEDFKGHSGEIGPGDIQWMTAGRGIVHAEMPGTPKMEGLQLWVNLKSSDKLCQPSYQEKTASEIPKASRDGVEVTIIAGESLGVRSETVTRTPAYFLDFKMQAGSSLAQNINNGWNSYMYMLEGKVRVSGRELKQGEVAVFDKNGNSVDVQCIERCRFVLLAGEPIGESIVQYGPFVMNENREIQEAMQDYRMGRNGFEGASMWRSRIAIT